LDKIQRVDFATGERRLFPAKGHHDFFVAASENYPAILNSLDRDLIDLSANLKTKLLAFAHRFAVDNGKAGGAIERNGADDECAGWNFTLIRSATGNFAGWLPANRPKRTARSGIDFERRFILYGNGRSFVC
jgi:hypothetical protein